MYIIFSLTVALCQTHIPLIQPTFSHIKFKLITVCMLCVLKGSAPPAGTCLLRRTTDIPLRLPLEACVCSKYKVCVSIYVCIQRHTSTCAISFLCTCCSLWPEAGGWALISARRHVDLIGWEIIEPWRRMSHGQVKEAGRVRIQLDTLRTLDKQINYALLDFL